MKKKRKPFGNYNIDFFECYETMEQVFGTETLTPSEMTKKLWKYIKKYGLAGKN